MPNPRLVLALLFSATLSASAFAATGYYRDKTGDLKINEPELRPFDIASVKVVTTDRQRFEFEVKTKEPINATGDNPPYFLVAVNLDGNLSTGNTAWTPGQDMATFIYLKGSAVEKINTYHGDKDVIGDVAIEGNTLRFTLTHDATRQKRMTFNIRSLVRRQPADGKAPYTVLDSSVPENERYNELSF